MTVPEVKGFGWQRGRTEIHRGREHRWHFLPKVKIEVAVADEIVAVVVAAIGRGARTGQIADGEVLVRPLAEVVRIRTGERGESAL